MKILQKNCKIIFKWKPKGLWKSWFDWSWIRWSIKNVIAVCAGIIDGVGYGDNTKAALITRGLAEITRLGISLGAEAHTFSGLAGMGDLVVTCTSKHSRNRFVGEQIGKGKNYLRLFKKWIW